MRSTRMQRLFLILLLVTLGPGALFGGEVTSVVGSDGAVLRVRSGAYEELFPGGYEADPTSSVLAMDVERPGQVLRFLVPETEDFYAEESPTLFYVKRTDLTFLLWEGFVNRIHPLLYLATFDGNQWLDVIELFGGSFTSKKNPQLVIHSDEAVSLKRTAVADKSVRKIVFVVWSEDLGAVNRKRMVPLVMEGHQYAGLNTRLFLADFLDTQPGAPAAVDPNLREALRLQKSPQGATVGFLNETTNEIVTLEAELLPVELSQLGEAVKESLERADLHGPLDSILDPVRNLILAQKTFDSGSLNVLADEADRFIRGELGNWHASLPELPDKARAHMVLVGARFQPHGLAGLEDPEIVDIEPESQGLPHHLKISLLSQRPAPEIGGAASIFLSRTGFDVLVAWQGEGYVYFRESEGEGWGGVQMIQLTESLDASAVYDLLAERILNR